jgi:hypothetical protein
MAQMTPMTPKSSNVRRHEIAEISVATSSGVKAPLTRVASQSVACARSRSLTGSQVVSTRVRLGNAPASPAPKSARVKMSDDGFQTQPVAAVKNDHQMTIRMRTRRGPIRSPSQPPGISNNAYAHANAPSVQLI